VIWFVLLVLWPLAELYVIVRIAEAIGFLWMLLLLLVSWPIGSRIIRREGRAAARRLRTALEQRRTPTNEVLDGVLVLLGGLLLLVPGFITDALGLLLLLPPTRAIARRIAARSQRKAWLERLVGFMTAGLRGSRVATDADVEATAADIDEPQLRP
jgi:UPF0716 protein FxsA